MSWFPSSNIASLAKNALKEAQKTIDKALDIKDEEGNHGINTTVSSVTDVATDFFSSWGVNVSSKPSPSKATNENNSESQVPISQPIISTVPSMAKLDKSESPSSLPSGGTTAKDPVTIVVMDQRLTASNVSCEVFACGSSPVSAVEEEPEKFQSLWQNGSDDSCSIDTSSMNTVEPLDHSIAFRDNITIRHPKPIHPPAMLISPTANQSSVVWSPPASPSPSLMSPSAIPFKDEVESSLPVSVQATCHHADAELRVTEKSDEACSARTEDQEIRDFVNQNKGVSPVELNENVSRAEELALSAIGEKDEHQSVSQDHVAEHDGDLDSSTATTVGAGLDSETDEAFFLMSTTPDRLQLGTLECEVEPEHLSSKVSQSSRATSSISVISEEKESPQISPTQHNETGDSSFEVHLDSTGHPQQRSGKSGSSSNCNNYCPSVSSISVIPSLQSTPLTHSRSNSNASSSFDRIEEYNNRSSKCPSHHFISSTSSSDIEVIPLDAVSLESLHRKRRSLTEVETQTVETWMERGEVKERIVEIAPAKVSEMLAEKDSEILQLREEGEKLSKKQFELSTAIKKLRLKEKESDCTVKAVKNELTSKNLQIEKLTKTLIAKEAQDEKQNETISKLGTENRRLLTTISQLRSELEDAKENAASMKASVEDASVEILELQNVIASAQRESGELQNLTRQNGELTKRCESLQKEIDQLRQSINTAQQKHSSRESDFKSQIANLNQKVHSLQNQLADNSSEIADVTMPLSLEIEKLQLELKSRASSFERREVSLQAKITELESKLRSQFESEKSLKSTQSLLQSSLSELEVANEKLTEEKSRLQIQLTSEAALRSEHLKKLSELSALESKVKELNTQVTSLKKENEVLKSEVERTEKRNLVLTEQLKSSQPAERVSSISSASAMKPEERSASTSPRSIMSEASYLDDVLDPNGGQNPCMTPKSFFDSFSSVNYIEGLQGHLRQKELEVVQLLEEVSKNEKIRKSLNDEIAHLTVNNQELLQRVEKMGGLQQRLAEVEKTYNAVLQMYGEKVEEADELRMDLQDVKEMYKLQIEQLLKKS